MTNQDVLEFYQAAQAYLSTKRDESKFTYAVRKVLKRAKPIVEAYHEQLEDWNIEHAAENPDGTIKREANGACAFKKEDLAKRNVKIRALARTVVTIEPHFMDAPESLTEAERVAFTGFVLAEADE
jgi:hypothetical protein